MPKQYRLRIDTPWGPAGTPVEKADGKSKDWFIVNPTRPWAAFCIQHPERYPGLFAEEVTDEDRLVSWLNFRPTKYLCRRRAKQLMQAGLDVEKLEKLMNGGKE